MMEQEKIIIKKLSKKFNIGYEKEQTVLSFFISLFSGVESKKEFWALRDVSFTVRKGENIGIIGRNGSGKSTLLSTIGGIYKQEHGEIIVNGKAIILSTLACGLKLRLAVSDNIRLVGSILGLGQKDIGRKFDSIVEFAGLQDFVNTKIYHLSEGMKQRLAFSINIHCINHSKPDILLVDEVFGGGADQEFKDKIQEKIEGLIKSGITLVMATHKARIIEKYCDRAIWLHKGRVVKEGRPNEVVEAYIEFIRRLKTTEI